MYFYIRRVAHSLTLVLCTFVNPVVLYYVLCAHIRCGHFIKIYLHYIM